MHIDTKLISILKYCFIVELFEKWRSALPPPPLAPSIWASHLGFLVAQLGSQDLIVVGQDLGVVDRSFRVKEL